MGTIKKIVNGVVQEIPSDEHMVKTIENGVVVEKPYGDVKKKSSGSGLATAGASTSYKEKESSPVSSGSAGQSAFDRPSLLPRGLNTRELNQTISNQNNSIQQIDKDANEAVSNLTPEQWNDPLATIYGNYLGNKTAHEKAVTVRAANVVKHTLMSDGYEAKNILQKTHFGNKDQNNFTAREIRNRAEEYDRNVEPLRKIKIEGEYDKNEYAKQVYADQIQSAAIRWRAQTDPQFKKDISDKGVDLNDSDLAHRVDSYERGSTLNLYLNNKDVITFMKKERPELIPAYDYASKNNIKNNTDFGINVVSNEVSKAIQKSGYNRIEPIFNYWGSNSQEYANLVAEGLFKDEPDKMAIYNKYVRDNQHRYLDAPSFMEGVSSDIKDVGAGIQATALQPFKDRDQQVEDRWAEEAKNVNADPKGMMNFLRNTGKATGFVMTLAAGGEVLEGAGLSTQTAQRVLVTSSFFGNELATAEKKYSNPLLAWTSASINTAMFARMSDIFPAGKVADAFGKIKPELNSMIDDLTAGKITQEAVRKEANNLLEKGIDFGTKTVNQNTKMALEMTAISGLNQSLDHVFGLSDKEFDQYHPSDELMSSFTSMFLSNGIVSGMAARGEMRRENKMFDSNIYQMASNPLQAIRSINEMQVRNSNLKTGELLSNLKFLVDTKKSLDDLADKKGEPLSEEAKRQYLSSALKSKVIGEQVDKTTDASIQRAHNEDIRFHEQIKDNIIKGEPHDDEILSQLKPNDYASGKGKEQSGDQPQHPAGDTRGQKSEAGSGDSDAQGREGKTKEVTPQETIQKAADDGHVPGMEGEMLKNKQITPDQALLELAKQMHGISDSGEEVGSGRKMTGFNTDVIEAVQKAFPDKQAVVTAIKGKADPEAARKQEIQKARDEYAKNPGENDDEKNKNLDSLLNKVDQINAKHDALKEPVFTNAGIEDISNHISDETNNASGHGTEPVNAEKDIEPEKASAETIEKPKSKRDQRLEEEKQTKSTPANVEQFNSKVDDVAGKVKEWIKKVLPTAELPEGTEKSGAGFDDLVDTAANIVKRAYMVGNDIKVAIERAIQHLHSNWDKAWGDFNEFEKHFRANFSRINPNVGQSMTIEEIQQLLDKQKQSQPGFVKRTSEAVKNSAVGRLVKSGVKTFDPFIGGTKSNPSIYNDARLTSIILRKNLGQMQRANEIAAQHSEEYARFFEGIPEADRIQFITNIERDVKMNNPELDALADVYRKRMDDVFETIKSIKDLPYIEDYFPHFWADPEAAKRVFGKVKSRDPLEGDKSFLRKRFYSDIIEGMKDGLQLVTTNPEDLIRLAEVNAYKFKMANDFFEALKPAGLVKYYSAGNQPADWKLVDDPLFKRIVPTESGDIIHGGWYMPNDAAEIVSRYSSRGLKGPLVDVVRGYNNMLNQAQLGISFFHGMTTTIDAAVTANAMGIDNLIRGKITSGLWNLGKGITIIPNMIEQVRRGDRVIKDYRSGVINDDVARMITANARTGFDAIYKTAMLDKFRRAWVGQKYGRVLATAIPAGVDLVAQPIFEYLVPRLKVGGFSKLSQNELEKLPEDATQEQIDRVIQKSWDDIENRLGQMTYDNLFWNKTTKDIAFLSTRSVGWNLGTIRAFGEGVGDLPKSIKTAAQGKGISPRTAWLISLIGQTALMGAVTTYIMTGKGPQSWRDYFYPRTGGKDEKGNDRRIQFPTYMRDVFNTHYRGLGHEVISKASPLLGEGIEIMNNEDFYGRNIVDPLDPAWQQGLDLIKYEGDQMIPFSFRDQPGDKPSIGEEAAKKFGITPAPKVIQNPKNLSRIYGKLQDIEKDFKDMYKRRKLGEMSDQEYDKRYNQLTELKAQTLQELYGDNN